MSIGNLFHIQGALIENVIQRCLSSKYRSQNRDVSVVMLLFYRFGSQNQLIAIIIHQTHYEKSDWSRAFNQFTIACELDMINVICAADITSIMSSSTSAWLLSPLECSPQKQNG